MKASRPRLLMHRPFMLAVWLLAACLPSLPTYVITIPEKDPEPGTEYIVPGPLPQAGSFKTPLDALLYACPRLLSLPDAQSTPRTEVTRQGNVYIERSWDNSTEYCAWIYATPEGQYEISWIATNELQSRDYLKKCDLPFRVADPRYADDPEYPDRKIIYVLAIHNHSVPSVLTSGDIAYITNVDRYIKESLHDNGQADLGIVAFFTPDGHDKASCGGFFQYTLSTNVIQKWTANEDGEWRPSTVATVSRKRTNGKRMFQVHMLK
jgi:hypothetical protein